MNVLKKKIYECPCKTCRSVLRLIEEYGAELRFSETKAGRLCELAVVFAAGASGIPETTVVSARRSYAEHLGLILTGTTSNADHPAHIDRAISNSNHNPSAKNRINLGRAIASHLDGRYFLK